MNKKLIGLTLLAALAGCGKAPEPAVEKAAETSSKVELSPDAQKIAGIEVEPVSTRLMQNSLDVPGVVASTTKGRAVVTPPVAGRVVEISVQLGDVVRAGQRLAVVDSTELAQSWSSIAEAQRSRDASAADLREASSEVELAAAKLSTARANLTRQQEFVKAGAFSQAPLQLAQSELNEAQSEVLSVQKELAAHTEQLRRTENLFKDGLVSKA